MLSFLMLLSATLAQDDAALMRVRKLDKEQSTNGQLPTLMASEHSYRAEVYASNRLFKEARLHWQKILENYPNDETVMPKTLFGIARSFMWEKDYEKAISYFDVLLKNYPYTKEGREGLAFKGACLVRLGRHNEAAAVYEQYIRMFPNGERIESSHINLIDALREARRYDEAEKWINLTTTRFTNTPTAINAIHAKLRMMLYREKWDKAIEAADDLLKFNNFKKSITSKDEIIYLKALALEKSGKRAEAVYESISNYPTYYGKLAEEKLKERALKTVKLNKSESDKTNQSVKESFKLADFPVLYKNEVLLCARNKKIDARFLLGLMKQESSFRSDAKSPAGARGLLQLTYDTALKYSTAAGYPNLQPEDLYRTDINIAIACIYIAELLKKFDGFYEAVAASYNGGEDNAERWLKRTNPNDKGVFVAEIGFPETKNYVLKVMVNYQIYRQLYDENLKSYSNRMQEKSR
jgi:soluble lytic murein transglycosylase